MSDEQNSNSEGAGEVQPVKQEGPDKAPRKAVEKHAEDMKTPAWEFAAAKAREGWAEGEQVTARQFRTAISEAKRERVG